MLASVRRGPMAKHHPKRLFLEQSGALHRHPDRVRAELFEQYRFFDPLDKIQVKYEMLRAHAVDGSSVISSRPTASRGWPTANRADRVCGS
jgi:hypothetical protein